MIKFGQFFLVTFRFKSGHSIEFKCTKINITKKDTIQSYEVEGIEPGAIFYCDIHEIESITYKVKFGFRRV